MTPSDAHAIVASAGDAILATDTAGMVTFCNRGAMPLLGYGVDELIGHHVSRVISEECHEADVEWRREAIARRSAKAHEAVWIHKDGHRVDVSLMISPLFPDADSDAADAVGTSIVARQLTDQRGLERSARHLAAIVESSDDAIISKDLNSIVRSWNSAAETLFGFTADEMIGKSVRLLIPDDRQLEEDDVLSRIRQGGRVDHYETIRRRKDGRLVPVSLTVSPIRRQDGSVVGASKIARDISDRERAEQERQRLLVIARDASRLKDEFLATLSHELRTPLNAIVGYVRLIQLGLLSGDRLTQAIDAVSRNATSLSQIVEDVLDVSRIVSGQVRLEMRPVDLSSVLHDALQTARPAADAKGVRLHFEDQRVPGTVTADPDRLLQVLWNLLSNAVKFTDEGGLVSVHVVPRDNSVEIRVTDTGAGIPAEFLPYVFDRFRQFDSGMTRASGGLGLGLSIVKQLTELQGGRVSAESAGAGHGSTFRIELPLRGALLTRTADEQVQPARASISDGLDLPNLRGVRVLAVDDDQDALVLVREILEAAGATVTTADSAQQALTILDTMTPHVLIADLGMPEMSGLELIDRVRHSTRDEVRMMPAVALTAFARSEDRTKAVRSGYHQHVAKPVDPRALMDAVAVLVHRPHSSAPRRSSPS